MVDDIRPPQKNNFEEQNKQFDNLGKPTTPLEVPHLYDREEGFVSANKSRKSGGKFKWPHISFKHATRKHQVLGASLVAVLLIGGATGVYAINRNSKPVSSNDPAPAIQKAEEAPKSNTEASKLTGVQVSPEFNKRPVTSIQIENSPDSRPQSGLHMAGVVFEAIAEGGITRFNASFQEAMPDYIGPVRSVRPYYAQLAAPFDPVFVHAGGSGSGLTVLKNLGLKDLDHGANGSAFRRVSDRYAPHNLYTSTEALDKASASRGYTSSDVKGFERKGEKASSSVTAKNISMSFSSPLYDTRYEYDQATNSYKRFLAGKPHTDQRSGMQIQPKVLVGIVTDYSQSGIYSEYRTYGNGKAYIFQDGIVQEVTWHKPSEKEQIYFTDAAGARVQLNAGQTWISMLKATSNVAFTP